VAVKPPNGPRFSRREASAASEAVGWKRMLGNAPHDRYNPIQIDFF
jgi:hypothetical protein